MARRVRAALLALLTLPLAGCVLEPLESTSAPGVSFPPPPARGLIGEPEAHPRDEGELVVVWPSGADARYQGYVDALRADGTFEAWADALNDMLALPYDIRVRHAQCGVQNAYYSPTDREIVLCWELLDLMDRAMSDPSLSEEDTARAVGSAWLFVFIHELGHALIDAYDLPVTGREEDAVDDLATLVLIDAGASDAAVNAAVFWVITDDGQYSEAKFADEHSLNAQRFYAILCTVYGSDPEGQAWLADEGYLPRARAERCIREYAQKDASWSTLLAPWAK